MSEISGLSHTTKGHPRTRVCEAELDAQVLALFDKIRIEDDDIRDWFLMMLKSQTRDEQAEAKSQCAEFQR